jgi:hypothetical protein
VPGYYQGSDIFPAQGRHCLQLQHSGLVTLHRIAHIYIELLFTCSHAVVRAVIMSASGDANTICVHPPLFGAGVSVTNLVDDGTLVSVSLVAGLQTQLALHAGSSH